MGTCTGGDVMDVSMAVDTRKLINANHGHHQTVRRYRLNMPVLGLTDGTVYRVKKLYVVM